MDTIIDFLRKLEQNNNREWFKSHQDIYKSAKTEFENLVVKLIIELNKFDSKLGLVEPKDCIFRIFKDVRFSNNKDPYKNNFGAFIATNGRKSLTPGYYIHIQPNSSFAGGGIYSPTPEILKKIRTEIYENTEEFKNILNDETFSSTFPEIYGEKLKTKPKGFDYFDDVELINHKHYAVIHNLKDKEITNDNLVDRLVEIYKIQKPFNDYLSHSISN